MDELWSSKAPTSCMYIPAGNSSGREDAPIVGGASSEAGVLAIRCREPEVFLYGDTATVLCYEEVEGGFLIATNVFIREAATRKMVHHQAGPTRENRKTITPTEKTRDELRRLSQPPVTLWRPTPDAGGDGQ